MAHDEQDETNRHKHWNTNLDLKSPYIQNRTDSETSLVVQWLRLHTPNAGGLGLIPSPGTRSHMPQLSVCMLQQKDLHDAIKIEDPRPNAAR